MTAEQQREATLEVLEQVHAAQKHSLLPRLAELKVFVDWADAREMRQVEQMIREDRCHEAWLVEAAESCDGTLPPASPDASTAGLHYADLRCLLPRVIAGVERLAEVYGRAMQESAGATPQAVDTIARIYHRHQSHLQQLRAIQARLEPSRQA